MEFDNWLEINEELLAIECAESGADRELDFNFDRFCEDRYFTEYPDESEKEDEAAR